MKNGIRITESIKFNVKVENNYSTYFLLEQSNISFTYLNVNSYKNPVKYIKLSPFTSEEIEVQSWSHLPGRNSQ